MALSRARLVATAGSYLFEPPGDVHTLVVDEGDYMITLSHNSGALLYCDEDGNMVGPLRMSSTA